MTVSELSLQDKIGQLLVLRVDLPPAFPESIPDVTNAGGVIVFGGSIQNITPILNRLQQTKKIPLLVTADLERGLGQQVDGACHFPHAQGLGEWYRKAGNNTAIYESARQTAVESRAAGIHMNYAPVADVNTNPANPIIGIRSFGTRPDIVTACCMEYIRGLHDGGMAATIKHFPGHGDTRTDSHIDLPSVDLELEILEKLHLAPFRSCIAAGVDAVMVGHISVQALDPTGTPASLSPKIITDLLRKEMGFDGVVVTDALNMGAITKRFSPADAAVQAILAGADLVLMPGADDMVARIEDAVINSIIPIERIDESVERILVLKHRLGLFYNAMAPGVHQSDTRLPVTLARACTTIIRGRIPRYSIPPEIIVCVMQQDGLSWLREKLRSKNGLFLNLSDTPPHRQAGRPLVVVTDLQPKGWSGRVGFPEPWGKAIDDIFTPDDLLISMGSPYVIDGLSHVDNFMCTYSSSVESQQELYRFLFDV
jgi:beta-N-acetylhexosaminidase